MKRWLNRRGRRALYRVRFRPGDCAVLELPNAATPEQARAVKNSLADLLPADVTVIVLHGVTPR